MSLVGKINRLCELKGISRTKLEQDLGFGKATIGKWDTSRPSVDKLTKVAKYFNIAIGDLIGDDTKNIDTDILLLARQAEQLNKEDREKLINHFRDTIDLYLSKK